MKSLVLKYVADAFKKKEHDFLFLHSLIQAVISLILVVQSGHKHKHMHLCHSSNDLFQTKCLQHCSLKDDVSEIKCIILFFSSSYLLVINNQSLTYYLYN